MSSLTRAVTPAPSSASTNRGARVPARGARQSLHETVRMYNRTRGSMDHLFMLVTFGDLVGMPIIPPYYTLRLLPFLVPSLQNWKRRLLREKDLIDHIF